MMEHLSLLPGVHSVDILHKLPGDPIPNLPKGVPGAGKEIDAKANVFNGAKATKVLGINYIPLEKCVEDM